MGKCPHKDPVNVITLLQHDKSVTDIFEKYHDHPDKTVEFEAFSQLPGVKEQFKIDAGLYIGDLAGMACKSLDFNCKGSTNDVDILNLVNKSKEDATTKAIDAFQILMTGGRGYPNPKTSRYIQKTLKLLVFDNLNVISI